MNVRKMNKDELEQLSFTDIGYNIIKLDKKAKTTVQLFKEICSLLGLSDKQYEDKIADFFTSMTVDKRFVLLNSVNWDLKENHSVKTIIDESEDEYEDVDGELEEIDDIPAERDEDEFIEEVEEESLDEIDTEDIDDDLEDIDDLEDLEIIDESPEELEE